MKLIYTLPHWIKPISLAVFTCAILVLAGCQTVPYQGKARNVKVKPQKEGIIGLPLNPRPEDRNVAMEKMTMNCSPGQYKITEEGEATIGQKKNSSSTQREKSEGQKLGSLFGIPVTTSGSQGGVDASETVTELKEWRINYKCVGVKKGRASKTL